MAHREGSHGYLRLCFRRSHNLHLLGSFSILERTSQLGTPFSLYLLTRVGAQQLFSIVLCSRNPHFLQPSTGYLVISTYKFMFEDMNAHDSKTEYDGSLITSTFG